ncbi:MAG: hypothetical protein IPJ48_11525 [Propionivibrio sp.]|uniref:Uncharacterized protein n=1 Tax=Candidatus Propionivibrio dominans TaxID=2954373 RepID=A0A9D7FC73_9RHOO|nr:hypothetical protein [Candidatus Propionivibrio dominans]
MVAGGSLATALGGIAIVGQYRQCRDAGERGSIRPMAERRDGEADRRSGRFQRTGAAFDGGTLRFVPVANFNGTPGGSSVRLTDSVQVFSAFSRHFPAIGSTGTPVGGEHSGRHHGQPGSRTRPPSRHWPELPG